MSEKTEHAAAIAEEAAAEARETARQANDDAYNEGLEAAAVAVETAYGWNAKNHAELIRSLKK
jgi:flagellar biosynthesis/type III secretory pathway protein FliH